MRRCRRLSLAVLCALPVGLSVAPAVYADAFDDVFRTYQKTGTIDPCKFTAAQLKEAKGQIPNDFEQYAPDFKDAIDAAAKGRAAGACNKKTTDTATPATPAAGTPAPPAGAGTPAAPAAPGTPTPTPGSATPAPAAATPTPQPTPSVTPAPAVADTAVQNAAASTDDNGSDLPAPIVGLAIVALLAALAAALVASARWFAVDPLWMQRSRHATAEAGWRTSAAWAEFTDWLRLGR